MTVRTLIEQLLYWPLGAKIKIACQKYNEDTKKYEVVEKYKLQWIDKGGEAVLICFLDDDG